MKLDDNIKEAVHAVIAQQILAGLDTTHRDALLAKSITEAIKSYEFRNAVSKVVSEKAAEIAVHMVDQRQSDIAQAIHDGFELYLQRLSVATANMLTKAMHGEGGTYQRAASLLAYWPQETDGVE